MAEPAIQLQPRTVQSAKLVNLAIVSYTDVDGAQRTQLCVLGDKTVLMLDSKGIGISNRSEPSGVAANWLKDAVFETLTNISKG